jgi:uncharacterized protein (TIGR02646 family)
MVRAKERILSQAASLGRQERLDFRERSWIEYRPFVAQLFHNKCAFCESLITVTLSGDVEHFRPKSSVAEDPRHPGYYWLAYEWENQYAMCRQCGANKRNAFPIAGERAYTPGDSLAEEKPMLLDPCADSPEEHLRFSIETGLVGFLTDRGRATIETFGLNREPLQAARLIEAKRMQFHLLAIARETVHREDKAGQEERADLPYLAIRRVMVAQFLSRVRGIILDPVRKRSETLPDEPASAPAEPTDQNASVSSPETVDEPQVEGASTTASSPPSLIPPPADASLAPPAVTSPHTGYIRRVVLHNFKSIENLDLTFDYARTSRTGWQVFLGENGTGKSSVLQAIAIALIGRDGFARLDLDVSSILRKPRDGEARPASGTIEVWLSTDLNPIKVTFDNTTVVYESGAEGANVFLRGYGPTRLLPRRRTPSAESATKPFNDTPTETPAPAPNEPDAVPFADGSLDDFNRAVANLFDPYVSLCDAPTWLAQLNDTVFNTVALTIKDVLRFRNKDSLRFNWETGDLTVFDSSGVSVAFNLLSHGQQSALVLATDIVSGVIRQGVAQNRPIAPKDFSECRGIILLDEIDAHLHPRWKMEIVGSLKRAFPYIQFIATTHEPLCLRGLEEREIIIVRRDDAGVRAEISPISPKGWRVDQLLTSELFGLFSTIDPDVDSEFQEYYLLLSKPDSKLTPGEQDRLETLRRGLRRHTRLGYTRRDQLLYEVIDDYLVKELRIDSHDERVKLREETKLKVRDIWERVTYFRDAVP